MNESSTKPSQSWIVGISIVLAATIFGMFFYHSRAQDNTVRVVGAATKRIVSDIVKWRITIARTVSTTEVRSGYERINADLHAVTDQLKANGIADKDINIQPVNAQQVYGHQGGIVGYTVQQSIFVLSTDVASVEKLALNPVDLFRQGVVMQSSFLEYYSSALSDIKKELLAQATTDAQKRAEEIARTSWLKVSRLVSARAGVFQINEPYSTEVRDYGVYNSSTKEKDVTVTVNATYEVR